VSDVDAATGEIVPAIAIGALTPAQASERAQWVRDVTKAALTLDVDYGTIVGTDKPSLFKSGAEMLLLAAGYGFTMDRSDDDDARTHSGVTYKCSVRRRDGSVVATCDGYAGYDESRFFTSAEEAEKRERANATKYQRPVRPDRCVEYRAPWNTLVKMAEKRALVGAALNACAASGLFIADLDDGGTAVDTAYQRDVVQEPPLRIDPLQQGADALTVKLNALPDKSRAAFRAWMRSQGMRLPPPTMDILGKMADHVAALEAEAAAEADAYGTST
jgi:hypothetical protein